MPLVFQGCGNSFEQCFATGRGVMVLCHRFLQKLPNTMNNFNEYNNNYFWFIMLSHVTLDLSTGVLTPKYWPIASRAHEQNIPNEQNTLYHVFFIVCVCVVFCVCFLFVCCVCEFIFVTYYFNTADFLQVFLYLIYRERTIDFKTMKIIIEIHTVSHFI